MLTISFGESGFSTPSSQGLSVSPSELTVKTGPACAVAVMHAMTSKTDSKRDFSISVFGFR